MSGAEITSANDDASYAKANRKQILCDTGTAIRAATKNGAGQLAYATDSSFQMYRDRYYNLNSTGTTWVPTTSNMLYGKWGYYMPDATAFSSSRGGILSQAVSIGTVAFPIIDATNGSSCTFTSTGAAGDQAGFRSTYRHTVRSFNPVIKFKFKTDASTNIRFFCGFIDSTSAVGNNDDPLGSLDGFGIGVIVGQTDYRCVHNDGTGVTVSDATGVTIDTAVHDVDIFSNGDNGTFYLAIDGTLTNTVTTEIPASGDNLAMQMIYTATTAVARVLTVYNFLATSDR